jgi:aminoglycoside phosphotransferase (APT) family kinase protein
VILDQTPSRTPDAEVHIDADLIAALLREQHPDLAALPLQPSDSGFDNAMYRLGRELAVRLPRRTLGAPLIMHEQLWLPLLATRLPLPIPVPVRVGVPGCGYPWCWSVVPWLSGMPADLSPLDTSQVEPLVDFLRALHVPAPPAAPRNEFRGVPLSRRANVVEERMRRLASSTVLITPAVRRLWEQALASDTNAAETWLHGDLHARNVLCRAGRITGIVDWGDMCVGDRATDLGCIWMLLDDLGARQRALSLYEADDATWARARGWVVAVALLLAGMDDPAEIRHRLMGERALHNVLAGP